MQGCITAPFIIPKIFHTHIQGPRLKMVAEPGISRRRKLSRDLEPLSSVTNFKKCPPFTSDAEFLYIKKKLIHNLLKFLKTFFKNFKSFNGVFLIIHLIYIYFNFNKYYSKVILFSNFRFIFSTVPQSFTEIIIKFSANFSKTIQSD